MTELDDLIEMKVEDSLFLEQNFTKKQQKKKEKINTNKDQSEKMDQQIQNEQKRQYKDVKIDEIKRQVSQNGYREPKQQELCEIVRMIVSLLPQCDLTRVIKLLYQALVLDKNQIDNQENQSKGENTPSIKNLQSRQSHPRYYEERVIAKFFCDKGYGYPLLKEHIGTKMSPNRYNNVATTIVRLSFRRLEQFVRFTGEDKNPLTREEIKIIKTPLVNCRMWLPKQLYETFHEFVRLTYKIGKVQPNVQLSHQLYKRITDQLRKRSMTFNNRRPISDGLQWNEQTDKVAALLYLRHQKLAEVKNELLKVYPHFEDTLDIDKLKRRVEGLIRTGVKKIIKASCSLTCTDVPDLKIISEANTRDLLRLPQGLEARIRILQFLLDESCCKKKLKTAIQTINSLLDLTQESIRKNNLISTSKTKIKRSKKITKFVEEPLEILFSDDYSKEHSNQK